MKYTHKLALGLGLLGACSQPQPLQAEKIMEKSPVTETELEVPYDSALTQCLVDNSGLQVTVDYEQVLREVCEEDRDALQTRALDAEGNLANAAYAAATIDAENDYLTSQNEQLTSENSELANQNRTCEYNLAETEDALHGAELQGAVYEQAMETVQGYLVACNDNVEVMQAAYHDLQTEAINEIINLDAQVNSCGDQLNEAGNQNSQLEWNLAGANNQITDLDGEVTSCGNELDLAYGNLEEFREENEDLLNEVNHAQHQVNDCAEELDEAYEDVEDFIDEWQDCRNDYTELQEQNVNLSNNLEGLSSEYRSLENFFENVWDNCYDVACFRLNEPQGLEADGSDILNLTVFGDDYRGAIFYTENSNPFTEVEVVEEPVEVVIETDGDDVIEEPVIITVGAGGSSGGAYVGRDVWDAFRQVQNAFEDHLWESLEEQHREIGWFNGSDEVELTNGFYEVDVTPSNIQVNGFIIEPEAGQMYNLPDGAAVIVRDVYRSDDLISWVGGNILDSEFVDGMQNHYIGTGSTIEGTIKGMEFQITNIAHLPANGEEGEFFQHYLDVTPASYLDVRVKNDPWVKGDRIEIHQGKLETWPMVTFLQGSTPDGASLMLFGQEDRSSPTWELVDTVDQPIAVNSLPSTFYESAIILDTACGDLTRQYLEDIEGMHPDMSCRDIETHVITGPKRYARRLDDITVTLVSGRNWDEVAIAADKLEDILY